MFLYLLFSVLGQTSANSVILKACPDKPNCVSTQADPSDTQHYMPALRYNTHNDELITTMETVLLSMPRASLESKDETSIHVTFRSRIFKFVDDVEVKLDTEAQEIHFRSAARTGHSDMGVNRNRMSDFVSQLKERLPDTFE